MASFSIFIDDDLAEASPVLGRMRVDGLTVTAVPFAERPVLLWRSGALTPGMDVDVLTDVLKVCFASCSVLRRGGLLVPCPALPPVEDTRALRVSRPHKRTS